MLEHDIERLKAKWDKFPWKRCADCREDVLFTSRGLCGRCWKKNQAGKPSIVAQPKKSAALSQVRTYRDFTE